MNGLFIAVSLIAAYLLGSFPSAYLVARVRKGIDIRSVGSRNMGAMNTFYKVGFWYGILVLAMDISKGIIAVAIPTILHLDQVVQLVCGGMVVMGHAYPVFLKFKGGKGGATAIGVLAFLIPWGNPAYLALFLILLAITRFPTLSYGAAFLCFSLIGWFVYNSLALTIFSVAILLIPGIKYFPRIVEMKAKSGGWKHLFLRRNLQDRL